MYTEHRWFSQYNVEWEADTTECILYKKIPLILRMKIGETNLYS